MALFNKKATNKNKTINRVGGEAYTMSPQMKLATMLLTSFAQNQFYRKAENSFQELVSLIAKAGPDFAAKAAIFARTEYGMRSITHVLAAELAAYASGRSWAKSFYAKIIFRPDDMMEIIAYYKAKGGKTLPNAMKKGFALAFDKFDGYQIAKYRGENKAVKLVDVVNLVHPIPTTKNAKALQDLVNGTLKSKNTWESKLSEAGQKAENKKEKEDLKAKAWGDLLRERKLGYFALLRNLRNIATQAPELIGEATNILTNRALIKKSMVLPFRYLSALDAIKDLETSAFRALSKALNKAIDLAMDNVPVFDGRTLVVLDDSGSMTWGEVKGMSRRPIDIGALFAAVLYKSNNADLMAFSDSARYLKLNPNDSTETLSKQMIKMARSGGTNFHAIFNTANQPYDRIIILSDMQGWMGYNTPKDAFNSYKAKMKVTPYIYSFDLQGYGSLQFPESKVFALAGFSEKVFDLMAMLETDPQALVNKIKRVQFA